MFGYDDQEGHAEVDFKDVRVPASNLIAGEGDGFMIAQARLGPGRIHHCMRAIGAAERALEAMCRRAVSRVTFGQPLATRGNVQDWIAESRIEIEMARLLTLKAAWLMDTVGNRHARTEIAAIKVAAPNVALKVLDRAIQVHGGGGVSTTSGSPTAYAHLRTLRLADGPDEVHKLSIARRELAPYVPRAEKALAAAGARRRRSTDAHLLPGRGPAKAGICPLPGEALPTGHRGVLGEGPVLQGGRRDEVHVAMRSHVRAVLAGLLTAASVAVLAPAAQASFGVTENNFEAGTCFATSCKYSGPRSFSLRAGRRAPSLGHHEALELNHTGTAASAAS